MAASTRQEKNAQLPGEAASAAPIIFVDPRRTVTVNACEFEAGKDRCCIWPSIRGLTWRSSTRWLTYIADKGWSDKDFIARPRRNDFDKARGEPT